MLDSEMSWQEGAGMVAPEHRVQTTMGFLPEGREDDLLVDWFKLIHEKHLLVRRESELIYM